MTCGIVASDPRKSINIGRSEEDFISLYKYVWIDNETIIFPKNNGVIYTRKYSWYNLVDVSFHSPQLFILTSIIHCVCSNVIDWFSDKSSFLYYHMSYQIILLPKIAQKNHNTHTDDI